MRSTGRLLVLLGIVSMLAGGYGYTVMRSSDTPGVIDWAADAFVHIGGMQLAFRYPQLLFRGLQAFTVAYREGLALAGMGGILIGGIMSRRL